MMIIFLFNFLFYERWSRRLTEGYNNVFDTIRTLNNVDKTRQARTPNARRKYGNTKCTDVRLAITDTEPCPCVSEYNLLLKYYKMITKISTVFSHN